MLKDGNYANPTVVIIDLGLSQAMSSAGEGPCGTPGYIPPETWANGKWFPRGDMFSFGVLVIQLLTDKIPNEKTGAAGIFTESCRSMDDVMRVTATRQPPFHLMQIRNPACHQWIAACVEKALQCRPRAPQVLEMPFFTSRGGPVGAPLACVGMLPGMPPLLPQSVLAPLTFGAPPGSPPMPCAASMTRVPSANHPLNVERCRGGLQGIFPTAVPVAAGLGGGGSMTFPVTGGGSLVAPLPTAAFGMMSAQAGVAMRPASPMMRRG